MAKPSPGSSDDPLLNANAFRNDDTVPPQKVQRTPTRKERVVMPGSPRKRSPTMVETPPILKETEEIVPSFRPRQRPPMALLTVYDDGRIEGEEVRLRCETTVLGRGQGDVVIPHDDRMSGKHAEIRRVHEDGAWKWMLVDLGSTNGTFVRVHKCSIKPGQELMVGHRRFRFEDAAPPPEEPSEDKKTMSFVLPKLDSAAMVELTSQGDGKRFPLPALDNWIGRAADCAVALDDPMIAGHHVRLSRDDRGWKVESHESRDGVWMRIEKPVTIDRKCSFQLGEQRFQLRVL
jgi:pSer/pThr/pTyr-binding forkhead associated (FHA) protein